VEELLNTISYNDLAEWVAYFTTYPFSEEREDYRNAKLIYYIVSGYCDVKKKGITLEKFMPKFGMKKKQTWQEQFQAVETLNNILQRKEAKKNNDS
jgi:hypothetical protein